MKRRRTLSIALLVSVVPLSLMTLESTTKAQPPPRRFAFPTGGVTPGAGQILRITVVTGGGNGDVGMFRFAWTQYRAADCNSEGVCRYAVAAEGATAPVRLSDGEAASFDILGTGDAVNVVVESNRDDARVNASIVDAATGKVAALARARHDIALNAIRHERAAPRASGSMDRLDDLPRPDSRVIMGNDR